MPAKTQPLTHSTISPMHAEDHLPSFTCGFYTRLFCFCTTAFSLPHQVKEGTWRVYAPIHTHRSAAWRGRWCPVGVTCAPGRCQHPVAIWWVCGWWGGGETPHVKKTKEKKTRRLSGSLSGCLEEIVLQAKLNFTVLPAPAPLAPQSYLITGCPTHPSLSRIIPLRVGGQIVFGNKSDSPWPVSPLPREENNCVAPCASLPLSLSPSLARSLLLAPPLKKSFPTERSPVRPQHPRQSPNIHCGKRQPGRQGAEWRRQSAAAMLLLLQPRHSEQDIPKQLEGADIWCCALVLGPPQNGPVLSGNLVIFSASLARLQF